MRLNEQLTISFFLEKLLEIIDTRKDVESIFWNFSTRLLTRRKVHRRTCTTRCAKRPRQRIIAHFKRSTRRKSCQRQKCWSSQLSHGQELKKKTNERRGQVLRVYSSTRRINFIFVTRVTRHVLPSKLERYSSFLFGYLSISGTTRMYFIIIVQKFQ